MLFNITYLPFKYYTYQTNNFRDDYFYGNMTQSKDDQTSTYYMKSEVSLFIYLKKMITFHSHRKAMPCH